MTIPILLLDCSPELAEKLLRQGYNVEQGSVGFQTGVQQIPSQVYEKLVVIYNPTSLFRDGGREVTANDITKATSHFSLTHLKDTIDRGATCLVFVNPISEIAGNQNNAYSWIPYMPQIIPTHDKLVTSNPFDRYPDYKWVSLAPIVNSHDVSIPVLRKVIPPDKAPYENDVLYLMWNSQAGALGVLVLRGHGRLIVLPRFKSNDDVIERFLDHVMPELYDTKARAGLVDRYQSPNESAESEALWGLQLQREQVESQISTGRVRLEAARREKANLINADATAKQIVIYYDTARRQDSMALFYLYKIIEIIENRFGGEAAGIKALGLSVEWKHVKRSANESYGDMRHAPKPGDVVKKWTSEAIKKCFVDTENIIWAYFGSLFLKPPERGEQIGTSC
jgi:hypothetical protein